MKLVEYGSPLPDGLLQIGSYAFQRSGITELELPGADLAEGVFADCRDLGTVLFREGSRRVPESGFIRCVALSRVNFARTMESIGREAFSGCVVLGSVTMPAALEDIDVGAFADCERLIITGFPEGTRAISEGAFRGCVSIGELSLPQSLKTVGTEAFAGCSGLRELSLYDPVFGDRPFLNVFGLRVLRYHGTHVTEPWCVAMLPILVEGVEIYVENLPENESDICGRSPRRVSRPAEKKPIIWIVVGAIAGVVGVSVAAGLIILSCKRRPEPHDYTTGAAEPSIVPVYTRSPSSVARRGGPG